MTALQPITLAAAQPPVRSRDINANVAAQVEAIATAAARVVVFPELSLTGYELGAEPVAVDDDRLQPLVEACARAACLALVGAPVAGAEGRPHIAMLAVDATGIRVAYRKMWLGGAEPERFAPGLAPAVLQVDGWRLGLAICKDTGVAQHAAETAALGIDAYVAGVCELAEDDQVKDDRARHIAVAHDVWVAVASFAGPTGGGFGVTAGHSAIWAPGGDEVARAGAEPGALARATLVPPALEA